MVQEVCLPAPVSMDLLLQALPAGSEFLPCELDDVEGIHHRHRVRQLIRGGGVVTGEPVHRDDPDPGTKCLGAFLQPRGHDFRGTSRFHIQQTGSTGPVDQWGQVDEDRRERVLALSAHVFPTVLIDAQDADPGQMAGISVDEGLCGSGGQLVDEVPAESECPADSGDAHLVLDEAFQDPGRSAFRGLRPGFGGVELVLEDRPRALGVDALVAGQAYVQACRVAGDRDVREPAGDVVTQAAFSAAVGAVSEGFSWGGFDDGDVVIGDVSAGDVDAELESAADDISDGTRRGRDGRLHGAALGERRVEELLSLPRAASLSI